MLTWRNTGDPTTPETLSSVNHLLPTRYGYTTGLGPTDLVYANTPVSGLALTGYTPRAFSYLDGTATQQLVYTLKNKIYRYPGNSDVSRGVAYTNGAFSFAQWRDRVYACNGADELQMSTTGTFANSATAAPKFKRICCWNGKLVGINNVASFTSGGTPYPASDYRFWVSGVTSPEVFDYSVDSTAYSNDIVDDGGPLVACAVLRGSLVLIKRSAVYVVDDTGDLANPYPYRLISDYFGTEWPDSVIEVNNILYWVSPTRNGEVVAFDGASIQVVSSDLASIPMDAVDVTQAGFPIPGGSTGYNAWMSSGTNGEYIVWSMTGLDPNNAAQCNTKQLYLNVPTGRFGYCDLFISDGLAHVGDPATLVTNPPIVACSNATQEAVLCVHMITDYPNTTFAAAFLDTFSAESSLEFLRKTDREASPKNITLEFSEDQTRSIVNTMTSCISSGTVAGSKQMRATPSLKWMSSRRSGEATYNGSASPATIPTASWNSTTGAFDFHPETARSLSAKTFGFRIENIQPVNSLTGFVIDVVPSGIAQAGGKVAQWR